MLSSRKITTKWYPFGMLAQNYNAKSYRFGFQNQEKDDEIYGIGNSINFKYRVTDTRLGRFWSVDPLASKYPHNSTYAFSENRVIDGIELEGLEVFKINDNKDGTVTLYLKDPNPKNGLKVIDENGVVLNHFKYCFFQCQMKYFKYYRSGGGMEGYYYLKDTRRDFQSTFSPSTFSMRTNKNDKKVQFKNLIGIETSNRDSDFGEKLYYDYEHIRRKNDPTLKESLQEANVLRIEIGVDGISEEDIINNLKQYEFYDENIKVETVYSDSGNINIKFGKYECEDCNN